MSKSNQFPNSHMILSNNSSVEIGALNTDLQGNLLMIGGVGTGKGRHIIVPNLKRMNSEYIITDIGGRYYTETHDYLQKNGYKINVVNLKNPDASMRYNPLDFVFNEIEAQYLSMCILGKPCYDSLIYDCSKFLLTSLIMLSKEIGIGGKWTFEKLRDLFDAYDVYVSLVEESYENNELSVAYKYYKAAENANSVFVNAAIDLVLEKLSLFCDGKYQKIFNGADGEDIKLLEFESKQVTYIIMESIADCSNILSVFYYQALSTIVSARRLFKDVGEVLPHKRTLIMTEFASTTIIPDFASTLHDCRSNANCIIDVNNIAQLKNMYSSDFDYLLFVFENMVYLGGTHQDTIDFVAKKAIMENAAVAEIGKTQCVVKTLGSKGRIEEKYIQ